MDNETLHNEKQAIDEYLDAVGQAFGEEYRRQMVVEPKGFHILIKHPDAPEGELVPIGYMPILTRHTRSGWFVKHAA